MTPLVVIALLGVLACDKEVPEAGEAGRTGAPRDSASVAGPAALPAPVEALGHYAEGAYDQVQLGNWTGAKAMIDSLKSATGTLSPAGGASDAPVTEARAAVIALETAIAARDKAGALRHANHLTELGARLADGYHPQVPADVTLLDFYGRELEIWSTAQDLPKLRETAAALRRTWDAVRPALEAKGGATESTQFEALVKRVESASTPAEFGATAKPVLDAVDGLEVVFKR